MCRVDDCDGRVEVFQAGDRKARKEHKCGECGRAIAVGERYHYEFGVLDGDKMIYKTCSHCMVAREWLAINCNGWVYWDVIEEIREHADDYPVIRKPLLAIVESARRKWQEDGALLPLPELPPAISV